MNNEEIENKLWELRNKLAPATQPERKKIKLEIDKLLKLQKGEEIK